MDNKNKNIVLTFVADNETYELGIAKRERALFTDYLRGNSAVRHINEINRNIHFFRHYETRLAIKRGDVFVGKFSAQCGNELDGMHFVVALVDSPILSQIVTVVPMKSIKYGKPLNPASDIYIGKIPGMDNGKEAIAVINQIRAIDKIRLFDYEIMNRLSDFENGLLLSENAIIECEHAKHYRLSDEQFSKIHKAALEYVFNGYIKHEKQKLVVFQQFEN